MIARQPSLFGWGEPSVDVRFAKAARLDLDATAWVEHVPGWVEGDEQLFEEVLARVSWRTEQMTIFDRVVDVPRLIGRIEDDDAVPMLSKIRAAIASRYARPVGRPTFALYRGGEDSVAWHRDRPLKVLPESLVAVLTLGGARKFLVRPRGGGASHAFPIRGGDLMVMGGTSQRDFEHSVPKCKQADPRIAVMYRWPSATDGSYDAL